MSPPEIEFLRALIRAVGFIEASRRLKLAPQTLGKLVGRVEVARSTISHARVTMHTLPEAVGLRQELAIATPPAVRS